MNNENKKTGIKCLVVDLLMALIFLMLLTCAVWIAWVYYFRGPLDIVRAPDLEKEPSNLTHTQAHDLIHFHNLDEISENGIQSKSTCLLCHGDYPHSEAGNDRRGFLNAHAWFIACEVCHIQPDHRDGIVYRWLDNETGKELTQLQGEAGNYGAMIVPLRTGAGKLIRVDNTANAELSQQYLQIQDQLSERDRKSTLDSLHLAITKTPKLCDNCHTENGMLSFRSLHYSGQRATHLESLDMIALLESYKEFYLPDMFEPEHFEK